MESYESYYVLGGAGVLGSSVAIAGVAARIAASCGSNRSLMSLYMVVVVASILSGICPMPHDKDENLMTW